MQDDSCDSPAELEPYSAEQNVFRAVIYKDWVKSDGKTVTHQAFLRLRKDLTGISIAPTPEDCQRGLENPTFGEIILNVGKIRMIQKSNQEYLDAVPDSPTHGNIKELPFKDIDRAEAVKLAKDLANISARFSRS